MTKDNQQTTERLIDRINVDVPEFAFKPNDWTEVFLQGISRLDVAGKDVLEIGVGTGVAAIHLLNRGVAHFTGTDIDERLMPCARYNIEKSVRLPQTVLGSRFKVLVSDLFDSLDTEKKFDLICGCIPQVPKPEAVCFGDKDSFARYFDSQKYRSALNSYGLGLNEKTLAEAKSRLKPDGRVVLVLSGRGGPDILTGMFRANGYDACILHETVIPQLKETTLAPLAETEARGACFYFYADKACQDRVTVAEAEKRRLQGRDSFHKIYAYQGKLTHG